MVVLVVTGLRAALEMSRVARMRVVGKGRSSTPKGHRHSQHKRRDQQSYTPLHLLSPPFAHSPQHHQPKERDAYGGGGTRYEAPPLLLCVRGWGSLFRALSVVTPPPFGSPATSLQERGPWALRPHLAAGLPLSRRRSARAHVNYRTNLEEGDIYAAWPFIWSQAGQLYARWLFLAWLFLAHELQRTQVGRTS